MKYDLISLLLILTINAGIYAEENKGRNPFKLPVEIERTIERQKPPAAGIPEPGKEIKENLDNRASEIEAEERAELKEKEAREEEEKQEEISKISLTGILFSDGRRAAILDRKILREGDMITGRKIIGIEKKLSNMDFADAEIVDVLRILAEEFQLNIVAGTDIKGKVTVSFSNVTLDDALASILRVNGYDYVKKDNIIMVIKLGQPGVETESKVFTLKHVDAANIKTSLMAMVSQ